MKLMVKGGVKRWIPDVFVGYYRELGYTAEGEETPSPVPQPEAVVAVDEEDQEQAEEPAAEEPEPAFICPHCGKSYKTESALKGHITRSHSGEQ